MNIFISSRFTTFALKVIVWMTVEFVLAIWIQGFISGKNDLPDWAAFTHIFLLLFPPILLFIGYIIGFARKELDKSK